MMNSFGLWRYLPDLVVLTLIVGNSPGCLGYLHPVAPPPPEWSQPEDAGVVACRDHIHVFFINGLDPFNRSNFLGLSEQVRQLGFPHVYFGQMHDEPEMCCTIARIHREDPGAKFVVVGYSLGANRAASLAHAVGQEGITLDLLVYLSGDTLSNTPADLPANARHIINITGNGCVWLVGGFVWQGQDLVGADNLRLVNVNHYAVPTHEQTLQRLLDGLAGVTAAAPPVPDPSH
jgi:hypothetical protein